MLSLFLSLCLEGLANLMFGACQRVSGSDDSLFTRIQVMSPKDCMQVDVAA